jgi:predicted AAA+ superfamily ATPase
MEKLKLNEGFVITQNLEKEESIRDKRIRHVPLWRWLSPFE